MTDQWDTPEVATRSPWQRRASRWAPWVLFLVQLVITAVVVGILSVVLFAQLTFMPAMIFGEYDGITSVFGWGFTAVIEAVGMAFLFVITGLIVGVLGLPVRLIGPLRRWWLGNGEVTIAGVMLGVIFIIVAYAFGSWGSLEAEFNTYAFYDPQPHMLIAGWLMFAFSLSMLVWPARWMPRRMRRWWTETLLVKHAKRATQPEPKVFAESVPVDH